MLKHISTALIVLLSFICGCSVGRIPVIGGNSISITTVDKNYFNVMLRFNPVAEEMTKALKHPVVILSDWDVHSIKVHLTDNKSYYHLLYLNPVEFWRVSEKEKLTPIAQRVNAASESSEVGLIVVAKNSQIKKIEDLKGKRFAFGEYESPYQFYNVLEFFTAENLPISLLKEVSYNKDSLSVVQKVLLNLADAGVVTRTWWQTTTDRSLNLSRLLKADLRVIGRTQAMPEYTWAVTSVVSDTQKSQMIKVLTEGLSKKPQVLAGFGAQKFTAVEDKNLEGVCERLRKIKNLPPAPLLPPLP
ncbi:MAG: PhnD/SsuA/transferrin family substrate-binding protein [Phycisphaerae bacterium]